MAKTSNVVTDPIADMLTRIRNAMQVHRDFVEIPFSKIKASIATILEKEGFVTKVEQTKNDKGHVFIKITFKVSATSGARVIQGLRRISKPSLRVYTTAQDMPKVLSGLGIALISTSKGIMTDKDARENNLGGEVLAYIW